MGPLSFLKNIFTSAPTGGIISDGESRWWGNSSTWNSSGTLAGEDVSEANLLTSSTCFACTKALAETTAGLPAAIMRRANDRKESYPQSPAWDLLVNQPNHEMDSFTFMELLVARVVNSGNFFAEIQRDASDMPIALWPIHPSRVTPMRDANGDLYWQVAHDYKGAPEFEDPTWRKKHLTFLSPHHMLNVVGFGSTNGIISPGILPGAQEIGIDFATRRYGADFFKSGAKPAGFVEHPGYISDETKRANFRTDLNRVHNEKAHQIGVLWDDAKYKQIGIAPEQAQFLQTRRYTAHRICSMYGVPPAIVGDYQDNKFATADAMLRSFVMVTLRNLVVRVEKSLNRQILNVKSDSGKLKEAFDTPLIYEIAIDGLLRGDPEMQAKTWQMMRESGAASANDWRRDVGMNPIEGKHGDYLIIPGGSVRLDNIDNQGDRLKNAKGDSEKAEMPTFDKEALAEMLAPLCEQPKTANGCSSFDLLSESVLEMAEDAVNRIHAITTTQIDRWREQDPKIVEGKLQPFWEKQESRLTEALMPCEKLAKKVKSDAVLAGVVAKSYHEHMSKLDSYDIFDSAKTALPDFKLQIEAILCD
jgi:HK97 family phage portal protein